MHTLPLNINNIPENTQKKIGNLTAEERTAKVAKYLEKRRNRSKKHTIHYECRKRVADQRIRVHGRFITKTDAKFLLNNIGVNEEEAVAKDINKLVNNSEAKELVNVGRKRRKRLIQLQ